MRVERQGDEPVNLGGSHLPQRLIGKGVPIAHARPDHKGAVPLQGALQGRRLLLGPQPDG
jgi:hypothetical protein